MINGVEYGTLSFLSQVKGNGFEGKNVIITKRKREQYIRLFFFILLRFVEIK